MSTPPSRFHALLQIARTIFTPLSLLAIAWLLHQGEHVLAIPGTRSVDHLRELAAGGSLELGPEALAAIERTLPVGWAHGDRYTAGQWIGPERFS